MIEIDKGIPITMKRNGRRPREYPFDELMVGDSFKIVGMQHSSSITASIVLAKNRTGFQFTCRSENGGLRVWRTK